LAAASYGRLEHHASAGFVAIQLVASWAGLRTPANPGMQQIELVHLTEDLLMGFQ
jgi:hypothetical protein